MRLHGIAFAFAFTFAMGPATAVDSHCAGTTALVVEHGGGLNACGCHYNRKMGRCHCHRCGGCGCACQPAICPR